MSDIERLAFGVVCVGFDGPDFHAPVAGRGFAGTILFGRNVESLRQTRTLTDALRDGWQSDAPPVIAIDQEGGRVARLRDGVEEIPSMMAVAAGGDPESARRAGEQMGFDLRRAGVNVDFAPVVDLSLFQMNTVIGTRSFGDDPQRVALFADAYAGGLRTAGIVPTFKHFPGHGSTAVDSHLDLPAIDLDEARLRSRDLVPFARLLPEAEALMTAHIVARAFDGERAATLSHAILTDLLRGEIGFRGVCFTDCMQMDAIAKHVGSIEGSVQSIAAGADCVLISHDTDLASGCAKAIADAVRHGRIPEGRLREAYERVWALRNKVKPPLNLDAAPPHPGVGREIGRRAVTLVRGDAHVDAHATAAISFEGTTVEGVQGKHVHHAQLRNGAVPAVALPLEPSAADYETAIARVREMHVERPVILMRRAHVYASQRAAVAAILQRFPEALLVSAREPFDAFLFPDARNVVCTYGDDAPSMAGLADVIFGEGRPQGVLPLDPHSAAK